MYKYNRTQRILVGILNKCLLSEARLADHESPALLAGWSMQQQQQHHHIIDQHRLFAFIPLSFHSLHSILSTDAVTAPAACLPLTTTIPLSSLPLRHRLGLHLPAQHPLVLDTSRYIYISAMLNAIPSESDGNDEDDYDGQEAMLCVMHEDHHPPRSSTAAAATMAPPHHCKRVRIHIYVEMSSQQSPSTGSG